MRISGASARMRLKEGCHINRSLLTLGIVIRKLRSSTPSLAYDVFLTYVVCKLRSCTPSLLILVLSILIFSFVEELYVGRFRYLNIVYAS